jgi:hypothetical protein
MADMDTEPGRRNPSGGSSSKVIAIALVAMAGFALSPPVAMAVDMAASVAPAWQRSPDPGFPN